MREFVLFLGLYIITQGTGFGQKIHRKCGPAIYLNTRTYLQNDSLNQMPFDAIVHINIRGWGTAAFINDSTLITAKHLADKNQIDNIDIYKNIYRNNTVTNLYASLSNNDFKVVNVPDDDCHFISNDISYIVFNKSGKSKLINLYTNHLEVADYTSLNIEKDKTVTLSGYPVDLAEKGLNETDILANKRTTFGQLLFDKDCRMVGYKLFSCSGDSGAPLWVEKNGKFYIIAIHHGGPEKKTIFNKEERNSAALIRDNILSYTLK